MSTHAKHLALNEVTAGMILAEDLLTPRGKVILPKGAVLTEANLVALQRYDVDKLSIQLSDDMLAVEREAELARHQERIERLFRNSANDKAATLLRQFVVQFRMEAV